MAELGFRQSVPIKPHAFGSKPELASQFGQPRGGQRVTVENGAVPKRLYFRVVSRTDTQADKARQRRVTRDHWFA